MLLLVVVVREHMATPTKAQLDAILEQVLAAGEKKSFELKATQKLCFGYNVPHSGQPTILFMKGKSDGGNVIENKCDACLISGKPSREVPRGFHSRAAAGRSLLAHICTLARFWIRATIATWVFVPIIIIFKVLNGAIAGMAFGQLFNSYFEAARGRTFCLGFQGGLPIFNEEGAVVAAFAGSGDTGVNDELCLAAGLLAAGLEQREDDGGFIWRPAATDRGQKIRC